ncbi:MAG: efflux RND transporter periplasmic adaptor subunit, partial [Pseudomonadota bacterium]|nr:efflux RND transporter periplasmic adaptor subunit [Pseudomonadota bacterium]
MRLIPVLTAVCVSAFLYFVVVERDRLAAFAGNGAPEATPVETTEVETQTQTVSASTPSSAIGVVAIKSEARTIDSAVVLRGETEADRQVEVRAETSGLVISEPLRRGTHVSAGQELCRLDVGTSAAVLAEAKARLLEAEARIPSAQAAVAEAEARLEEAKINDNAARKLSEGGFASSTRVA